MAPQDVGSFDVGTRCAELNRTSYLRTSQALSAFRGHTLFVSPIGVSPFPKTLFPLKPLVERTENPFPYRSESFRASIIRWFRAPHDIKRNGKRDDSCGMSRQERPRRSQIEETFRLAPRKAALFLFLFSRLM
ncbi:hypothetical protein J2Z58_000053 [Halobacillus andaensis]|nr:hypothetical protein [Halobacillus andaensis]